MRIKDKKLEVIDITPAINTPQYFDETVGSISFVVSTRVADTDAATAANYGVFFIAPFPCTLVSAQEAHATAGSNGSAVTLTVEKLTGTTAKGSGITMLGGTFNLKGTANTVQTIDKFNTGLSNGVTSAILDITLQKGDRMALKTSGTLTAVNDVAVTVVMKTDLANLPI